MEKELQELHDYFDVEVIGSYLFVRESLLDIHDISDIDLVVSHLKISNCIKFLKNKGYTISELNKQEEYSKISDGYLCKKNEYKPPFHIMCKEKDFEILNFPDRIKMKSERLNLKDREQLTIVFRKLEKAPHYNPNYKANK